MSAPIPPVTPVTPPVEPPAPVVPPVTPVELPVPDPVKDEPLGETGKKALEAERRARSEAVARSKQLETELAELRKGQMSEQEKAIQAAKDEGRNEALASSNARLLEAKLLAAAAGKLADPNDAIAMIDRTKFLPGADGNFDDAAITVAITELVTSKPYLATPAGARPAPGSANGGPQGTGPAQLTESDLEKMTPEAIDAAHKSGQLNEILGIK